MLSTGHCSCYYTVIIWNPQLHNYVILDTVPSSTRVSGYAYLGTNKKILYIECALIVIHPWFQSFLFTRLLFHLLFPSALSLVAAAVFLPENKKMDYPGTLHTSQRKARTGGAAFYATIGATHAMAKITGTLILHKFCRPLQ